MLYPPFSEKIIMEVNEIFSFYHFQFAKGYVFKGESHPFWEMVYVISGQVDIGADEKTYMLSAGDVIFHKPDEFHSIWANYAHSPDMIVMTFSTSSEAAKILEGQCFRATSRQVQMFHRLLKEAQRTFSTPLDMDDRKFSDNCSGGVYVLRLVLTELLMDIYEYLKSKKTAARPVVKAPNAVAAEGLDGILKIMKLHPQGDLKFSDICHYAGMSGTVIKQLFKKYINVSPMAYYEQIRMGEARRLLREKGGNIAAVADELGFSNAGYFATRFKKVNGMSPHEYIKENSD